MGGTADQAVSTVRLPCSADSESPAAGRRHHDAAAVVGGHTSGTMPIPYIAIVTRHRAWQ